MRLFLFVFLLNWQITEVVAQPRSTDVAERLKQQFYKAQQDTTRLRLCVTLSRYYHQRSQFDSLHRYVQQGLLLLKRSPSHLYSSDLHYFLAKYYRHISLYNKGIQTIKQAIAEAQQAHSPHRIAECQYALAVLYSDAGQLPNSVDQIASNLKFLGQTSNKPVLASNYLLLIALFTDMKNRPMQMLYTNRYLTLANSFASVEDQMFANAIKASLLDEQNRFKEAEVLYKRSLRYAYLTHNPVYITEILKEQGIIYRKHGEFDTSVKLLQKSFIIAQSRKLIASMATAKSELANTYLALQRPKQALQEAEYSLSLSRRNKTLTNILASIQCLGNALEANGKFDKALKLYKEQQQLKEQTFTENNVKKIAWMQAQFETETKEQTIKILQKNAQINHLEVLRQQQQLDTSKRTQLTNAIIICLLLLLIGVIFYFLLKSRQNYLLLQKTTHELVEANTVKDKLFSIISHDLRSPLASIKNTLYQGRQSNELSSVSFVDRIDRQVDSVLTLLTNLLDWSMIQFRGVELTHEPLLLQNIIDETVSQASDLIEQKQLGLINQVVKTHVVMANRHQLGSVIRNLLHNAIKFTPANGYIRLQSVKKDGFVELTIRDSGTGMSSEQLANLLTKPEIHTGTAGEAGTGLGLRISKELIGRLNGTLQIESWPQKGTLVRVQLKAGPDQVLS